MKKYLLFLAMAALSVSFTACSDDDDEKENGGGGGGSSETIVVSLEVTGLDNNQATINASLTQGKFYGAKLIEAISNDDVTIDTSSEIQLINYVIANGVDIELPYSNTITGLRAGAQMFTAVIAYDSEGLAATSAFQRWTVVGLPDGWSEDNDAGDLGKIEW